jgi:hypothetical protein
VRLSPFRFRRKKAPPEEGGQHSAPLPQNQIACKNSSIISLTVVRFFGARHTVSLHKQRGDQKNSPKAVTRYLLRYGYNNGSPFRFLIRLPPPRLCQWRIVPSCYAGNQNIKQTSTLGY